MGLFWEPALGLLGLGAAAVAAKSWECRGRERRNSNIWAGGEKRKMQIVMQGLYRLSDEFRGEKDCCWGVIALFLFYRKHRQEI